MADLIVTFSRAIGEAPIAAGASARTEAIAISGSSTPGALVAEGRENCVHLLAEADCWVAIGADPEAAEPGTEPGAAWPMASGATLDLYISRGQGVAVIER